MSSEVVEPAPGALMGGGRYKLEAILSHGNRGCWSGRALGVEDGLTVVIKKRLSACGDGKEVPNWSHPHLLNYLDCFDYEGSGCLVAEWVEGTTLLDFCRSGPLLSPEDGLRIARQCLEGLAVIHGSGLLHLDLKPENIIVSERPEGLHATLIDLAFWQLRDAKGKAGERPTMFGSIFTMAPELFDNKPTGPGVDLYALGCCLYYAVTGRHAFRADNQFEVMLNHLENKYEPLEQFVDNSQLARLVTRLLTRKPEDRPESAREALKLL